MDLNQEEEARRQQRRERIEQMKIEKEKAIKQQKLMKRLIPVAGAFLLLVAGAVIVSGSGLFKSEKAVKDAPVESLEDVTQSVEENMVEITETPSNVEERDEEPIQQEEYAVIETIEPPAEATPVFSADVTSATNGVSDEIISDHVIFLNVETGEILAQKSYKERISPASMTKVLTLLVAAEQVENLDDTFTITLDITDFCYRNDCSNAGFEVDETVSVRDLMYGTILPSGADAALGIAYYVSGSQEAFVELMNEKVAELGLSESTHFTNCMGIYDEDHYSTVYDIAMIMEAAEENDLCREILNARVYTTSITEAHPEGMILSNWFLRRIEDHDTGGQIIGGKTGYVDESRSCATSAGIDEAGNRYICVTTGSSSSWRCIFDHVALYSTYAQTLEETDQNGS